MAKWPNEKPEGWLLVLGFFVTVIKITLSEMFLLAWLHVRRLELRTKTVYANVKKTLFLATEPIIQKCFYNLRKEFH